MLIGGPLDNDYEINSLDNVKLKSNGEIEMPSHPKYPKYNLVEMHASY